jgi:uncharacterized protein (UPF0332 family)
MSGGATESDLHSAASRAYYAALHASAQSLPQQFQPTSESLYSKSSPNAILAAVLSWANSTTSGRAEARQISRLLPKLKALRKKADYELESDFSLTDSSRAVRWATKALANAERALSN